MRIQTIRRFAIFVMFLAVCAVSSAAAQEYLYATGSPTYGVKIPIENGFIDVSNGNLHLEIPLSSIPQRGKLQLNERLVYDSRIWKIVQSGGYSWQPTNVPNSWAGWRLTTGMEAGSVTYNSQTSNIQCGQYGPYYPYYTYSNFQWTDPQGTPHTFTGSTMQYTGNCGGPIPPGIPTLTSVATDGSGYSIVITNYTNAAVWDANGTQVYPQPMDANGNSFSLDGNGDLVDTLGRTPVIKTTSGNHIYYDVLTIGGSRERYTVTLSQVLVNTAFQQSAVSEFKNGFLNAIQSIQLPNGSSYSFTYDSGWGSGGNYGELTSMTLPTEGTVYFTYNKFLDSYQNQNQWVNSYTGSTYYTFSPSVLTQCSSGGTGCKEKVTVYHSGLGETVYTLTLNKGAWNTQTDIYQGYSSTGTKLASLASTYDYSGSVVTKSTQTTTLPDTGQIAQAVYSYNSSGQPIAIKEWDYYTGSPSTIPTRETDNVYGYSVNGSPLLTKTTILDSAGAPVTQTIYNYDEGTTQNRGNLTSAVRGLSETQTTQMTYSNKGMVLTVQDPLQRTTTYSYDDTGTYVTGIARPTTSNGVSHSTGAAYDMSTGLVTSRTDENGQVTTYAYDSKTLRPVSIGNPDGGGATYSYPSTTQSVQTVPQTSTSSIATTTNLDGYGRVTSVVKSDPVGDITTTTSYDSSGNVYCVSTPHRTTASSTDGTTCSLYDALGRVYRQTQPDSTKITNSYSGNTVTTTDENENKKKYAYDAFRRLISVWEPDATGTLSWETAYLYNALDKLVRVDQKGGTTDTSTWRTRTSEYNSLGQLTKQITPEAQITRYTYDGAGNAQTVQDADNRIITNAYDELDRLIKTSYSDNSSPSVYAYDLATWGAAYPKGRLVAASRGSDAAEYYSYDSVGRVVSQSNPRASNTGTNAYPVTAAYDLAGNLTQLTYPDGRTIAQSFDSANRLASVVYSNWGTQPIGIPYLSSAAYTPTGALTGATFGNGIQLTANYNSRGAITSLKYVKPNTQNCSPAWGRQYAWAGNAQNLLTAIDTVDNSKSKRYTYDPTNRITSVSTFDSATATPATSGSTTITISGYDQSYTYNACPGHGDCPALIPNYGNVTVTINGTPYSTSYTYSGGNATANTIANALAGSMNGGSLVNATVSGGTITVTAKATGVNSNYSVSTSCTYNTSYFTSCAWSAWGGNLSGGVDAGSGAGIADETYEYDPWGNLKQSGVFSFQQGFGSDNRISTGNYVYDNSGNLTQDALGNRYGYTVDGMLASSNNATYAYDADSRRVRSYSSTRGTTEYVYFNGQLIAMLNVSTGTWTDFIYGAGGLIAEVAGSQNASPIYRITDHLGSVAQTRDASGNLLDSIAFMPYGQSASGATSDPMRFAGLELDGENGSYHAWYRQHSPAQGRWLSPDPYEGSYDFANPQSLNRYAYVNGMPLSSTDPSGLIVATPPLPPTDPATISYDIFLGLASLGKLLASIFGGGHPTFHGSLHPRPQVGGGESLGMPVGMAGSLTNVTLLDALGVPSMSKVGCNPICDITPEEEFDKNPLALAVAKKIGQTAGPATNLCFWGNWTYYATAAGATATGLKKEAMNRAKEEVEKEALNKVEKGVAKYVFVKTLLGPFFKEIVAPANDWYENKKTQLCLAIQ